MPLKFKLHSISQARPLNCSRHPRHPFQPYVPLNIACYLLPGARGYSRSMKMTGTEVVGIAANSDTTIPILAARVAALEAAHDFKVTTINAELTSALRSASRRLNAHASLNSGPERGEQYSKDIKNSILRSLARAGHHETFENIRKKYFVDAKEELTAVGILGWDQPYNEEGKRVIRVLLENGSMPESAYFKAVGKSVGMRMLDGNVFQLDLDTRAVSFQSTVMREYCRRESMLWV